MTENPQAQSRTPLESRSDAWIGGLFWIVLIAGVLYLMFQPDPADVFLTVTSDTELSASGSVVYHGAPVMEGKVHLAIDAARSQRYVASTVAPIGAGGAFSAGPDVLKIPADMRDEPLRVTAEFVGRTVTGTDKEGHDEYAPIVGTSTVYLRSSPPLLGGAGLWTTVGGMGVLAAGLIVLFTGGSSPRKDRILFFSTYLVTFVSVTAPVVLTLLLSQNDYLVNLMQEAPIGIVRGKAKGTGDPQWLLNIGGAVRKAPPKAPSTIPPSASTAFAGPDGNQQVASSESMPGSGANDPAVTAAYTDDVKVEGGLAVPFYVVFLAMLGAGINMTIQVPRIQLNYTNAAGVQGRGLLAATAHWFRTFVGPRQPSDPNNEKIKRMADIRQELIQNYMYLLSAPIIAITVYYLLQVVGANTTEPIVVVLAFATGFASDKIVARIIEFAETTLISAEQKKREQEKQKRQENEEASADTTQEDADQAGRSAKNMNTVISEAKPASGQPVVAPGQIEAEGQSAGESGEGPAGSSKSTGASPEP